MMSTNCPHWPPFGGPSNAAFPKVSRLDEDDKRLGQYAVMRHRLGSRLGAHQCFERLHVRNVHHHRHVGRVLRIHKFPDVRDADRSEDLLALR